jgi:hypothetical protein
MACLKGQQLSPLVQVTNQRLSSSSECREQIRILARLDALVARVCRER